MALPLIVMGATGRMGSTITHLASGREDVKIAALVDRENKAKELPYACSLLDVADSAGMAQVLKDFPDATFIDFTAPEASLATARLAAKSGHAAVIGTTGLTENQKKELAELAKQTKLFYSANMSVGINVLLEILPLLTQMLGDGYDMDLVELHHKHKKDAPSGTALRLAECVAEAKGWHLADVANYHREGITGERKQEEIGLQTVRGGDIVGVHTLYFMGPGERIEVTHQAHSRENFAEGALKAAVWLARQKPGNLYSMQDVLKG